MTTRILTLLLIYLMSILPVTAQETKTRSSTEIYEAIQKLQFLGSVLYLAAHPDDENTRLISYLSNEVKANTAYLSLTRGDGGQNRIGPEIREQLGLIRTHELLEARKIDGGKQYFTRANDFGYSKHPDETFNIWNKDKVMADVVWVMRKFKPDIIINRFDHRTPGRTHGHHTGSAILGYEAFEMINDPNVFPEQLRYVDTWQPRRLFFNTSWWFYGSREAFEKADKSKMVSVDVGVYFPLKGKSNTEIAAESRTMHKSQGFGSTGTRGHQEEYLELLKGDMPDNPDNLFDGINTSWTRVKGAEPIADLLKKIEQDFDFEHPDRSIPDLLALKTLMQALPDGYWKKIKIVELQNVIQDCLGLYLEAVVSDYTAIPGDSIRLSIEATNRSDMNIELTRMWWGQKMEMDTLIRRTLHANRENKFVLPYQIPTNQQFSNPYWLQNEGTLGLYDVKQQELIGVPRLDETFQVRFSLEVAGQNLTFIKEFLHKDNDPVKGAVYRPFEIIPAVSLKMAQDVYIFPDHNPRRIQINVSAGTGEIEGVLSLPLPDDWRVEPNDLTFSLSQKGEEKTYDFEVYPPENPSSIEVKPLAVVSGQEYSAEVDIIEYDHIPIQTLTHPAKAKMVKLDLRKAGNRVLYVQGSGDAIPSCLEQIGYSVQIIEASEISPQILETIDACIIGIRAYNLNESLKFKQEILMEYVHNGGTLVVQYNTTRGLKMKDLGPYPFQLSRDRVTVEEAEVRILAPEHKVLHYPNKIGPVDFDGWVQERGLYFPDEWDERYTAILSANDPGESPKDGGLLVTEYGNGYFVYTGYSWFRQLPAGVPGAYRLFTNLISLGNTEKP